MNDTLRQTGNNPELNKPVSSQEEFSLDEVNTIISHKTRFEESALNNFQGVPDFFFYSAFLVLIMLAWIKIIYAKLFYEYILSSINYLISIKVFNDVNVIRKRIGYSLNLLYGLSGGLYLFAISWYYHFQPFEYTGFLLFVFYVLVLTGLMFSRYMLTRIIAILFDKEKIFTEFNHHIFIFNKLTGIVIIPFTLLIPYTEGIIQQASLYLSFILIGIIYLVKFLRLLIFINKKLVSYFYLFLYLCVLEILPLLIVYRLVTSLDWGS